MSDKVTAAHLERKAMLYIRQSSPHQVLHHQESRRLQQAMKDRAAVTSLRSSRSFGISTTTLRNAAEAHELPALHPLQVGPWISSVRTSKQRPRAKSLNGRDGVGRAQNQMPARCPFANQQHSLMR